MALVADGDISQYHYIRSRVNIKTIAVFLKYRIDKAKMKIEAFNGDYE